MEYLPGSGTVFVSWLPPVAVNDVPKKELPRHRTPTRIRRLMYRMGLSTVSEFARFSADDLFQVPRCGHSTVYEVVQLLKSIGLTLKGDNERV